MFILVLLVSSALDTERYNSSRDCEAAKTAILEAYPTFRARCVKVRD